MTIEITVYEGDKVTDVMRSQVKDARNAKHVIADAIRHIADMIRDGEINPSRIEVREISE